nr:NHL repeat-containing protein [bacterium]
MRNQRNKSNRRSPGIPVIFALCLAGLILSSCSSGVPSIVANRQLRETGNIGDAPGMFREPRGLSITPRDTLLVTDFRNFRVQELTFQGDPLNTWGEKGTGPGKFSDPTMTVMDREGNIYVADTWNHRVQKYHSDTGTWQGDWASRDFYAPRGITIDNANRIYVVNT